MMRPDRFSGLSSIEDEYEFLGFWRRNSANTENKITVIRTFRVSDCIHTAYDITQSFQTFRFEKTRCDRTAVSAPTYDRHGRISTKSSDVPKQVRQRNIHRAV